MSILLPIGGTLDMQPEGLSESKIININEKSGCDKQDGDVPEEVMPRKKSH